jgi:hypothetical protein
MMGRPTTYWPASPPPVSSRCGSAFQARSARPATQVSAAPDPAANDGAIPCSGGLAGISGPSLFPRRALIRVMLCRAASRRPSLAGRRQGLVPMRKGQEGHWIAVQTATSFACPTQQSRQRRRRACSGDRGSWPEALSSSCVISRGSLPTGWPRCCLRPGFTRPPRGPNTFPPDRWWSAVGRWCAIAPRPGGHFPSTGAGGQNSRTSAHLRCRPVWLASPERSCSLGQSRTAPTASGQGGVQFHWAYGKVPDVAST